MICCILPMPNKSETTNSKQTHKIHFPETSTTTKRIKRSELETSALTQRKALLLRKYGPIKQQALLNKAPTAAENHRIVTAEEDVDPYWNIKTSNFKTAFPKAFQQSTSKYDYNYDDYVEDYMVELPKPGLTGLYSDNSARPPNWSYLGENPSFPYGGTVSSEEDGGTSFVYSATVDPRLGKEILFFPYFKSLAFLTFLCFRRSSTYIQTTNSWKTSETINCIEREIVQCRKSNY